MLRAEINSLGWTRKAKKTQKIISTTTTLANLYELLAGFFRKPWLDESARVREVVLEQLGIENVDFGVARASVVERHQVAGKPSIVGLVLKTVGKWCVWVCWVDSLLHLLANLCHGSIRPG